MLPISNKEKKRFGVLLINTNIVYWPTCIKTKYLERIQNRIDDKLIHKELKKEQEYFKELKDIIIKNNITDSEIISFIYVLFNQKQCFVYSIAPVNLSATGNGYVSCASLA
jgi:hypothetical protein